MNIVLIGFMGVGKTSVARALGHILDRPVLDLDTQIVEMSPYPTIADIFQEQGETYFRQLETQACRRCVHGDALILATGGGIVEREENLMLLCQNHAVVVYLQASFDTLCHRVGQDPQRPLFADIEKAQLLYQRRLPLYEQAADLVVSVESDSVPEIAQQIAAWVRPKQVQANSHLVSARTQICVIWGDPVTHSLSPTMHNAAYRALGLDQDYVFVAARVRAKELSGAVQGAKAMDFRGITCTIPHKEAILPYLDEIDHMAKRIGAVNTVVQQDGRWRGYNTDWLGIVRPLEQRTPLANKRVAIIGAGGTAKAAAFGVLERGASEVWIFNRSPERAMHLAQRFGGMGFSLHEVERIPDCDILIQTTSVGMADEINHTPIPPHYLRSHHTVLDAVYTPRYTRLLQDAQIAGAQIISGAEMFLHQGMAQFALYTGVAAPESVMRQVIDDALPPEPALHSGVSP